MVAILLFVSLILFLLLSIPIGVSLGLASLTTIRTMAVSYTHLTLPTNSLV